MHVHEGRRVHVIGWNVQVGFRWDVYVCVCHVYAKILVHVARVFINVES